MRSIMHIPQLEKCMNKLFVIILTLACMLAAACDRDNKPGNTFVIDGEPAKLYVGHYTEITPSDIPIGDKILSNETIVLLPEAVPTKKTSTIEYETLEVKDNRFSLTINLLFTSEAALLEVDSLCYKHEVYNTYDDAEYEYAPGTYTTGSRINPSRTIRYDVTPQSIYATYIDNTTQAEGPSALIYILTDGVRHEKEIIKTTASESESYTAEYSGKFKVACTDIATMQNEDFTFEFDPLSGMLKEIEPENKEIGNLEPASERVVCECF